MTLTNEELKRSLAKLLWENGFGDEPYRNWRMAELMIIEDGFLAWRRQALKLKALEEGGQVNSDEYQQAQGDFMHGVAYWIYATSLAMSWPSHDPEINWRIAGALKHWFCTVDFD
jgi:hypothetical protein